MRKLEQPTGGRPVEGNAMSSQELRKIEPQDPASDGGQFAEDSSGNAQKYRYVRAVFGGENSSEPWMTLYEIDSRDCVHRHVQVHSEACRFAPEDILMCSPVSTESMLAHSSVEEINPEMFELLWAELAPDRGFLERVPDQEHRWEGRMTLDGSPFRLVWACDGFEAEGWIRVPGFDTLFVQGGVRESRRVCAAIFTDHPICWALKTGQPEKRGETHEPPPTL